MATRRTSRTTARRRRPAAAHLFRASSLHRRQLRFEPLEDRRMLAELTVTTPVDVIDLGDGLLSLREAIFVANTVAGADTIDFDFGHDGPETILLTQGELAITDALTINGPGADLLTIDASGNDPTPAFDDGKGSRVFNIDDNSSNLVAISLSGVRLTGGDISGRGGAINSTESLDLRGVTIERNTAIGGGGGVYVTVGELGSVNIINSLIAGNRTMQGQGGGITIQLSGNANGSFIGSRVIDNSSAGTTADGGGLRVIQSGNGSFAVTDSEFLHNSTQGNGASGGGAAIRHSGAGRLTVAGSTFIENFTDGTNAQGGGLYIAHSGSGNAEFRGNEFIDNSTDGTSAEGGGLFAFRGGSGESLVAENMFDGNSTDGTSANGGGLAVHQIGTVRTIVVHNTVQGNSIAGTSRDGLGIFVQAIAGRVEVVSNVVSDNVGPHERGGFGGIGSSTNTNGAVLISKNDVYRNFGGIVATGAGITDINDNLVAMNFATGMSLTTSRGQGGTIRAARNIVTANHSTAAGGGLVLSADSGGTITVLDSTVAGNSAEQFGIGVYTFLRSGGVIEITRTTIHDNHATRTANPNSGYAGGVSVRNEGGSITFDQVTISSNSADREGGGIWIDNPSESGVSIRRSTVTNNTADADEDGLGSGGGIFISRGIAELDHTILAGNHDHSGAAPDIAGLFNANRSLIGNGATLLGPLADNGGPTLTHALLAGSPAIDAGDPAAMAGVGGVPVNDQRGAPFTRVYGGRIDIGAFELQPTDYVLGDFNRDGSVDAADYVVWRKQLATTVPPGTGADGNGDGTVNDADYSLWTSNLGHTAAVQDVANPTTAAIRADAAASVEVSALDAQEPPSRNGAVSRASFHEQVAARPKPIGRAMKTDRTATVLSLTNADRMDRALVAWLASQPAGDAESIASPQARAATHDEINNVGDLEAIRAAAIFDALQLLGAAKLG